MKVRTESRKAAIVDALSRVLRSAMERGLLRESDPVLRASQLLSLTTGECDSRLYQLAPEPLTLHQIKVMAEAAVEMFLHGASVAHG